jgi:multiple sugar transport system substrate-binding protein
MQLRRLLRASAAVLVLAAAACGGGSGGGTGDITLLVPSYSDHTKPYWTDLISRFERANPGSHVRLEVQSWDDINDVVRTRVQGGQAPDILNIDAFAAFAKDDLLYRADEVASPATLTDLQDGFRANAGIDGTQYAFPLIASTRTLFYNRDLFARAGIAAPPKTWADLLADGKKISALGGGVYGYGMPLGREEAQAETSIWTFGAGGDWVRDGKITVDTPENLAGVRQLQTMVRENATQPDPGATNRTPLLNVFIQGKLGMIEGLVVTPGQIRAKNPALRWGTAPIPTRDGRPVTLGVADHLMAFRNDGSQQATVRKFVDFVYDRDNYVRFVRTEGFIPTTKSGAGAMTGDPRLADFLATLPNAKFYPSTNTAWSATQGAIQSLIGQVAQGKEPAAVLAEIQRRADDASR